MEKANNPKTIKEVFRDYNSNNFELNGAKVVGINLYKRKNVLEIFIESDKKIDIMAILALEKYMEQRFQVREAKINIKYNIEEEPNKVEIAEQVSDTESTSNQATSAQILKQWPDIVEYISHKHPIAKAFLKGSTINIVKNKIEVTLALNGKEFLESNKFNEVFANLIENIYGKKYTIEYTEKVSEETISKYKENIEKQEKATILQITQEVAEAKNNGNIEEQSTPNARTQTAKKQHNKQYVIINIQRKIIKMQME